MFENTAVALEGVKACLEAGDGVRRDGGVGASHMGRSVDVVERRGDHVGLRRGGGRVGGRGGGGGAATADAAAESGGEGSGGRGSEGEAAGAGGEGGARRAEEGPPGGHGGRGPEERMDGRWVGQRGFGSRPCEERRVDWGGSLRTMPGVWAGPMDKFWAGSLSLLKVFVIDEAQ